MHVVFTRFPYESALGGEERHTVEVAQFLQEQGAIVSFVGSCPILQEEFKKIGAKTLPVWGLRMPVTPLTLLLFLLLWPVQWFILYKKRAEFFPSEQSSLYCLSLIDKLLLTPLAPRSTKVVWVEHQRIGRWLLSSPLRFFYTSLGRQVSIIPISTRNKEVLLHELHLPESAIKHIIHGVNVDFFFKKRIDLKDSAVLQIGYSGRLEECKGLHVLVEAVQLLQKKHIPIQVTIRGKGDYVDVLQEQIQSADLEDIIKILPPTSREDYRDFLQSLDVYVLPSLNESETFGLSPAEAIIAGAQLVVTDVSGIAHVLPTDSGAQLITPNDSKALVDAIITAGAAARALDDSLQRVAVALFNKERMLREYEQLLTLKQT